MQTLVACARLRRDSIPLLGLSSIEATDVVED